MSTRRWALALALLSCVACQGTAGRRGPPRPPAPLTEFVPFNRFLENTQKASPKEFARRPDYRVRSDAEFARMKHHVLSMYEGVVVKNSFVLDNAYVDCIDVRTQPSVTHGGKRREIRKPPPPIEGEARTGDEPQATPVAPMLDRNRKDRFGNVMYCEPGFIPMRRLTLEEMSRYPTLEDYLSKSGRAGMASVPSRG